MANSIVCQQNLRSIYQGLSYYRLDYHGWLPANVTMPSPLSSGDGPTIPWFMSLYADSLLDLNALSCPEDPYRFRIAQQRPEDLLHDPNAADYASYGINSFIMNGAGGNLADLDRHGPTRPLDTILVADLGPDSGLAIAVKTPSPKGPRRNNGVMAWDDGYDPLAPKPIAAPWLTLRHGRGINVLTLGGAVRHARTDNVMRRELRWHYDDCAAGGCSLCNSGPVDHIFHYSFAQDHLYWWTGPISLAR